MYTSVEGRKRRSEIVDKEKFTNPRKDRRGEINK